MSDSQYNMSKKTKQLISSFSTEERRLWKAAMVDAEFGARGKERFTMNYDVKPNGKRK